MAGDKLRRCFEVLGAASRTTDRCTAMSHWGRRSTIELHLHVHLCQRSSLPGVDDLSRLVIGGNRPVADLKGR